MKYNYSVKEAVWIAAAAHAYVNAKTGHTKIKDFCLTAAELRSAASVYTQNEVQEPRIRQWFNADHPQNSNNYLREVLIEGKKYYRVSAGDEKKDGKEWAPEIVLLESNRGEVIMESSGHSLDFGHLMDFITGEYPDYINGKESDDMIDYIGVLDYLANNQEIPYSNPESADISAEEKSRLEQMKKRGQWAVGEMKKMADKCKTLFDIDTYNPGSWLDGSRTKTRKYLWTQLKYKEYFESPISVSILVEKENTITRYRISLELKNDGIKEEIIKQYHSHLELPLSEGMTYATHVNEWGNPIATSESAEVLKKKIESGEERKVQICIYVTNEDNTSNEQLDEEVMAAVGKLIPYYEHVLGINKDNEWWPPVSEYKTGLDANDWINYLEIDKTKHPNTLKMLAKMLELGGASTCKQLSIELGSGASAYVSRGANLGKRVAEYFNLDIYTDEKGKQWQFTVPFLGKYTDDGLYAWKLRDELREALEQMNLSNVGETDSVNRIKYDHNTILFGPPGTGKTYNSAIYAVAICDGRDIEDLSDYEEVMDRYNELKRAGRIAFTTFHQSYGYEEFIEGIKPVMGENNDIEYTIVSGVFKKFCDKARMVSVANESSKLIKENPKIWGMLLDGTGKSELKKNCYDNNVVRLGFTEVSDESVEAGYDPNEKGKMMVNYFKNEVEVGDIVVVVGNTSKSIDGIGIITGDYVFDDSESDYKRKRDVKWLLKDSEQVMVEYLNSKGRQKFGRNSIFDFDYIGLDTISEILEQNGVEDILTVSKENKPFVFVIDEINRGNISKIFGELITLIENTKREGMPEAASAILPYSHEEFSVPSNVYILGTMNTADRSIQMMDTALRRRFQFVEKMPSVDVLRELGIDDVDFGGVTLNIPRMLEAINNRIAYLYDREHTIGHAFFTGLKDDRTIDKLSSIFEKSVIPLLQEYFYEDYQKIQLVLGDNAKEDDSTKFIVNKPANPTSLFMGNAEDYLDEKEETYTINHNAFKNITAYKLIANNL